MSGSVVRYANLEEFLDNFLLERRAKDKYDIEYYGESPLLEPGVFTLRKSKLHGDSLLFYLKADDKAREAFDKFEEAVAAYIAAESEEMFGKNIGKRKIFQCLMPILDDGVFVLDIRLADFGELSVFFMNDNDKPLKGVTLEEIQEMYGKNTQFAVKFLAKGIKIKRGSIDISMPIISLKKISESGKIVDSEESESESETSEESGSETSDESGESDSEEGESDDSGDESGESDGDSDSEEGESDESGESGESDSEEGDSEEDDEESGESGESDSEEGDSDSGDESEESEESEESGSDEE